MSDIKPGRALITPVWPILIILLFAMSFIDPDSELALVIINSSPQMSFILLIIFGIVSILTLLSIRRLEKKVDENS